MISVIRFYFQQLWGTEKLWISVERPTNNIGGCLSLNSILSSCFMLDLGSGPRSFLRSSQSVSLGLSRLSRLHGARWVCSAYYSSHLRREYVFIFWLGPLALSPSLLLKFPLNSLPFLLSFSLHRQLLEVQLSEESIFITQRFLFELQSQAVNILMKQNPCICWCITNWMMCH